MHVADNFWINYIKYGNCINHEIWIKSDQGVFSGLCEVEGGQSNIILDIEESRGKSKS